MFRRMITMRVIADGLVLITLMHTSVLIIIKVTSGEQAYILPRPNKMIYLSCS